MKEYKLSPSDFAFLWEECKRCFYLKVVRGFPRPKMAFPQIFNAIDRAMTARYNGMHAQAITTGMPEGVIRLSQQWVRSRSIPVGAEGRTCCISGRLDAMIEMEHDRWGLIDFKTTKARAEHLPLYSRQLHAYAYAWENPAREPRAVGPVSRLGLLIFEPIKFVHNSDETADLKGSLTWVEIRRDDEAFFEFMRQVISVLAQPVPPEPDPDCMWCLYRQSSREYNV